MKATLIAHTELALHPQLDAATEKIWAIQDQLPLRFQDALGSLVGTDGQQADLLAEFAGRLCYLSFHRPNAATAQNSGYIANILKQQHFSVLEHASASFLLEGVSRSLTHELVRHRHFSYSMLSQRYVAQDTMEPVIPPVIRDLLDAGDDDAESLLEILGDLDEAAKSAYDSIFITLREKGVPLKAARGAARAALLESTETTLIVTGNHRAWREFMVKRDSPHADQEIHELASALLVELKKIAPNTYQDM